MNSQRIIICLLILYIAIQISGCYSPRLLKSDNLESSINDKLVAVYYYNGRILNFDRVRIKKQYLSNDTLFIETEYHSQDDAYYLPDCNDTSYRIPISEVKSVVIMGRDQKKTRLLSVAIIGGTICAAGVVGLFIYLGEVVHSVWGISFLLN